MKVYISSDIEGVGCVVRAEHSSVAGRDYGQSRHFMTDEVNAAIRAAFDSGAEQVLVSDSHNVGLNLLPEELDERAELIMGSPRPLSMMEGVDQGFDAVMFIGYHAKPGTANGLIAHNFHSRIRDMRLNGVSMGELGINAALAGFYNAPVVLISGDEATCKEARDLLPFAETVAVKRGIGAYAAQCLHPAVCRQKIYDAGLTALKQLQNKKPFRLPSGIELELELTTASTADRLERVPGLTRVGPLTMRTGPISLPEVYGVFLTAADIVEMVSHI